MRHHRSLDSSVNEEAVTADISDFQSVLRAMRGIEAVVHLAADAKGNANWPSVLERNIIGTYNVFEAARIAGIKKVVFASSNHVNGFDVIEGKKDLIRSDLPLRPDSLYGVSKVFGESLGRYYCDKFGISVICLRIGACSFQENPSELYKTLISGKNPRIKGAKYSPESFIAMWISDQDMAQLIHKSLETNLKFGIFYGTSDNSPAIFDLTDARDVLGYRSQDKIENYLK